MTERLDKRQSLYGEPRLSDAQVRALRELAKGPAWYDRAGAVVRQATLDGMARRLWVEIDRVGKVASLAPTGRKILAAIDEAA